ncbi:MAG: hypothetical protein EOP10_10580 [Proteobacteria bacterium]|nr:MAG: hypothetical protein EOP10_10580 [Pseudomonadota bacterium]
MHVFGKLKLAFVLFPLVFSTIWVSKAEALPIGFGRNQGDLDYDELKTDDFIIYHDRRAPREAKAVLDALQAAKPKLETWIGVKRDKPLPVILSSTTSNASFANFITDVIELQTLARGGRDLAWHEFTHNTMYRHLDNIFGPAGSIIHLPWMPAWFIEGLAEATSASSGSDMQYGVERYYALSGREWPTYDKLHALYDGTRFSTIGYAVSGSFVSYLLRTYDADKLPQVLESFYKYSMPWWWPWSFVPFNKFMPMDEALREWTGKSGAELYEEYKSEATKYWTDRKDLYFVSEKDFSSKLKKPLAPKKEDPSIGLHSGQSLTYNSSFYFQSRGGEIYYLSRDDSDLWEAKVNWKDSRAESDENVTHLPEDMIGPRVVGKNQLIYLKSDVNENLDVSREFWIQKDAKHKKVMKRLGYVSDMFLTSDKLVWTEERLERQSLCYVNRSEIDKFKVISPKLVRCESPVFFPNSFKVLGQKTEVDKDGQELMSELWIRRTQENLMGDKHTIEVWNAASRSFRKFNDPFHGKPDSLGFAGDQMVIAYADGTSHFLRRFDATGKCQGEHLFGNIIDRVFNSPKDFTIVTFWQQDGVKAFKTNSLPGNRTACRAHDEPSSPLQMSMRYPQASLKEILGQRNPWRISSASAVETDAQKVDKQAPLGSGISKAIASEPASWRPRPVFAFPWIGIDALGYQYGTLTVPLMDHLQNETVQVMAVYGAASRYPSIDLNLTSNRFTTTLSLDVFRHQTWNGSFGGEVYYYDERGAMISAGRYIQALDLSLRLSYKESDLIPFLGDDAIWAQIAKGYIRETSINMNKSHRWDFATLGYYLSSDLATEFNNKNYDYEQTGGGLSLYIPIELFGRNTQQNWGTSYSRVRGTRRKLLKEAYRPLRTYVPGSGGGLNEINQPIFGPGVLTSAVYGDTQARANFSWTFPVMPDLAKLVHIVYLQRLDFTTFFNYGNAWYHTDGRPNDWVKAHGYNLDLTADVKGVKLNAGIGVGQVVGRDWEMYALFGFDALIQQADR